VIEITDLLWELITRPTPSGEEGRLVDFLKGFLEESGFNVREQEVFSERVSIIGKRGEEGPLICAHIDTYPPFEHPHPYTLKWEGEVVFARGVVDAKGQIAALLKAVSLTKSPCQVAFTVDEERSGKGSEVLDVKPPFALVLEPTELNVAVAEAGSLEVKVEVWGKESHIDLPQEGENAIHRVFEIFGKLKLLPFMQKRHRFFRRSWASLAFIRGGKDVGVLPGDCEALIEASILPGVKTYEAVSQIENLMLEEGAFHEILDISPPFEISSNEEVVKRLISAGSKILSGKPRLVGFPSWTDAQNLVAKGIPTAVFGAGSLSSAHTSEENVSLSELETLAQILVEFLRE
jgi:acetylornithine deacetylase/succinyl-diaminopimelate desuccinylase-like protein